MTYMTDDEYLNKHQSTAENIDSVKYPVDEKLILDNDNFAIVTRETESRIRIGLVHNVTSSVGDTIQVDHPVVDQ